MIEVVRNFQILERFARTKWTRRAQAYFSLPVCLGYNLTSTEERLRYTVITKIKQMGLKVLSLTTCLCLEQHTDLWRSREIRSVLSPSIIGFVPPRNFCEGTWRVA